MELVLRAEGEVNPGPGVEVADQVFGVEYNEPLVHQIVTAYLAAGRSGTRAQKNRAAVSGGGKKPWRQKGSGRARAGSSRNPLWRGGGVTFAAQPANYAQKVNRKMYRGAMRSILSELVRSQRLVVVEDFSVDTPKTREVVGRLQKMDLQHVLIVTDPLEDNLRLATRNLHWVGVCGSRQVDPIALIAFEKVMVTVPALRQIEEQFGT
jgi:large subunit ribosomal protein L4